MQIISNENKRRMGSKINGGTGKVMCNRRTGYLCLLKGVLCRSAPGKRKGRVKTQPG
jgi:hypothetical protein